MRNFGQILEKWDAFSPTSGHGENSPTFILNKITKANHRCSNFSNIHMSEGTPYSLQYIDALFI